MPRISTSTIDRRAMNVAVTYNANAHFMYKLRIIVFVNTHLNDGQTDRIATAIPCVALHAAR